MSPDQQITYNIERKLSVPDGIALDAIMVRVEITPATAGCLIYGWTATGDLAYVEVHGAQTDVELPFVNPQIYVKYLEGLEHFRISTLGWKEPRGAHRPPNVPPEHQH